jgi:NAD+ synthase (glutamine-hydrolysing)
MGNDFWTHKTRSEMNNSLTISVAQLNFWVGDIQRNLKTILDAIETAKKQDKADLIVFPELALSGYPPEDLLFRPELHEQIEAALKAILQQAKGIDIVLGYPQKINGALYNAAVVLRDQTIISHYQKQKLPNYGVFDEARYFSAGNQPCLFSCKQISIGILICEDIWYPEPVAQTVAAGAELIICLNASPFHANKAEEREALALQRVMEQAVPLLYVHGVGGQDELIFDGGSMLFDGKGNLCQRAPLFKETLIPFQFEKETTEVHPLPGPIVPLLSKVESAYQALVLGVRDYVQKNNFSRVLLGLSGGIDSALTLAIAVDALGAKRVQAVLMPSRYTALMSIEDAVSEAKNLQVEYLKISIEPVFEAFLTLLDPVFKNYLPDATEENLQARGRGMILMALSNKTGRLVLTTGNKSEMAVGYSTLYGDMAGGLDVLKDVSKTLVYQLAKYRNQIGSVIPKRVIERPPSAELAPNQKDEDTLPPYHLLDQMLEKYIEQHARKSELALEGLSETSINQVVSRIHHNEYKRRQAPPGIRITKLGFGRDWRYPISSGFA